MYTHLKYTCLPIEFSLRTNAGDTSTAEDKINTWDLGDRWREWIGRVGKTVVGTREVGEERERQKESWRERGAGNIHANTTYMYTKLTTEINRVTYKHTSFCCFFAFTTSNTYDLRLLLHKRFNKKL